MSKWSSWRELFKIISLKESTYHLERSEFRPEFPKSLTSLEVIVWPWFLNNDSLFLHFFTLDDYESPWDKFWFQMTSNDHETNTFEWVRSRACLRSMNFWIWPFFTLFLDFRPWVTLIDLETNCEDILLVLEIKRCKLG